MFEWFLGQGIYGQLTLEYAGTEQGIHGGTEVQKVADGGVMKEAGFTQARVANQVPAYIQKYEHLKLKRRGPLKLQHRELHPQETEPIEELLFPSLVSNVGHTDRGAGSQASTLRTIRARRQRRDQSLQQVHLKPTFFSNHDKWEMRHRLSRHPVTRLPEPYVSLAARERLENSQKAQKRLAGEYKFTVKGGALDPAYIAATRGAACPQDVSFDPFLEASKVGAGDEGSSRRRWLYGPFRFAGKMKEGPLPPKLFQEIDNQIRGQGSHRTGGRGSRTARF